MASYSDYGTCEVRTHLLQLVQQLQALFELLLVIQRNQLSEELFFPVRQSLKQTVHL